MKNLIPLPLTLGLVINTQGQDKMQHYFNEEHTSFIGVSGAVQCWARYTKLNPGSTIQDEVRTQVFDFSIRRYWFGIYGQVSDRTRFTLTAGDINLNYASSGQSPRVLDLVVDQQLGRHLTVSIGRHGWTGLSRYAAPSTTQGVGVDMNFSATPLVNVSDDFLRKLGVAFYGQFDRIDYRFVLAQPYACEEETSTAIGEAATFTSMAPPFQVSGYVKYQWLDKESQASPFSPGTYAGDKELFTIGAGFLYQPETTVSVIRADTVYHDARSLAVDVFYEKKLHAGNILTLYASYLNHNLGPDFVRMIGANNPANGSINADCVNGAGNSFPVTGTGNVYFFQAALVKNIRWSETVAFSVQPYANIEYAFLEALNDPVTLYEAGFSYFMKGQSSRITFGYQHRPVFMKNENRIFEASHKPMIVLQYQFSMG